MAITQRKPDGGGKNRNIVDRAGAATGGPTTRVNVDLDVDTYYELKGKATEDRLRITEVLRELIRQYLAGEIELRR